MKRFLSFLICICFLGIMNPINLTADNELNLSDYEYYYIDSDGNHIYKLKDNINTRSGNTILDSQTESMLPLSRAASGEITVKSSLGVENASSVGWSGKQAYARSEVTAGEPVDSMTVYLEAWGPDNGYLGNDFNVNPPGTRVMILSSYVRTPKSPFPLDIGAALSEHGYNKEGYKTVIHHLIWP